MCHTKAGWFDYWGKTAEEAGTHYCAVLLPSWIMKCYKAVLLKEIIFRWKMQEHMDFPSVTANKSRQPLVNTFIFTLIFILLLLAVESQCHHEQLSVLTIALCVLSNNFSIILNSLNQNSVSSLQRQLPLR